VLSKHDDVKDLLYLLSHLLFVNVLQLTHEFKVLLAGEMVEQYVELLAKTKALPYIVQISHKLISIDDS
jgi:hypothetical protein